MRRIQGLIAGIVISLPMAAGALTPAQQVAAFNRIFTASILRMDNAAVLRLWANDGVTLLPGQPPIAGKSAIRRFMDQASRNASGYKLVAQKDAFHGLHISGNWAAEWAETTQVVQPPHHKPQMTIKGKMLLVLHREADGQWRIEDEAWTPGL